MTAVLDGSMPLAEHTDRDRRPVALLGGAGRLGLHVARLLVKAGYPVRIVEERPERGERAAAQLRSDGLADGLIESQATAWRDQAALDRALDGARLVIVTAGEEVQVPVIAHAALRLGAHFMDCQPSDARKLQGLQPLSARSRDANLYFVTDCGARPGLATPLIRLAAQRLDGVTRADVAIALALGRDPGIVSPRLVKDHLRLARRGNPLVLTEGAWAKLHARYFPTVAFDAPIGKRVGYPVFLGELRGLKEQIPTLTHAGFYLCGFGPLVDYGAAPAVSLFDSIGLKSIGETLLSTALVRGGQGESAIEVRLDADGLREGWPTRMVLSLTHPDPTYLPACCIAVCAERILQSAPDGQVTSPTNLPSQSQAKPHGLHQQGWFLDPDDLLESLSKLGIGLQERFEDLSSSV